MATISLFREFEAAGLDHERPPPGWEEAREVTSILVDAVTPKDGYTAEHAHEVARLSWVVGTHLGFDEEGLEWLVHGALLHDLGKLGVADEILKKPGPLLTEEEWTAVVRHPRIGARMIEPIEPLSRAAPVVRHHHERPDGTGYPDGLEGEEIPLAARIVAAADAYDVMLRGRPYRPKKNSPAEALRELSDGAGGQFDARVVEVLGRVVGDTNFVPTKRRAGHMVGAQQRWRELRAQGAQFDAAARTAPGRRHLEALPEGTSAAKPLGLVWVLTPSYSITLAGLRKVLEGKADVHIGRESPTGSPSCVVLYAGGMEKDCLEGMRYIRELYPGVPLLVLGTHLDLALARSTLENGADGFVHAMMDPAQVLRAVEVVQKGELAAPRQLLGYLLNPNENPKIGNLSARQREVLELVVEGLSNAEIAGRLYLSESTIKQHLGAAYKVLGVRNRTEAAKPMRENARRGV